MGFLHTPKKMVKGKLFYFPVQADLSPIHFGELQRCFMLEREQVKNPASKVSLSKKRQGQCLRLLKFRKCLCSLHRAPDITTIKTSNTNAMPQALCLKQRSQRGDRCTTETTGCFCRAGTNQMQSFCPGLRKKRFIGC